MGGTVVEAIGRKSVHVPTYPASAWRDRDSFQAIDQARGYARYLSRMYPATPYRIIRVRRRAYPFVVRFVPAWKLQEVSA